MGIIKGLREAKAKITPEESWTSGAYARTPDGVSVMETHPDAVKWCALGAINCVMQNDDRLQKFTAIRLLDKAARERGKKAIHLVNDELGHEPTLECFDAAVEEVKELREKAIAYLRVIKALIEETGDTLIPLHHYSFLDWASNNKYRITITDWAMYQVGEVAKREGFGERTEYPREEMLTAITKTIEHLEAMDPEDI